MRLGMRLIGASQGTKQWSVKSHRINEVNEEKNMDWPTAKHTHKHLP